MDKPRVLGQTHGVDITTGTVVLLATGMGVGVAEDDTRTTNVDALTTTRASQIVVVPALHILNGQTVLVAVVTDGWVATEQWTVALYMVGIRPLVPITADSLVAHILHHKHGFSCRLVDIQHLTTIFCLLRVKHIT